MEQMEAERLKRMDKGKSDSAAETEKATRNQAKLGNAEETYQDLRDKFCEDAEDILLPRKSDFLKLALRVVQFQQTLYKSTAKKAEGLTAVIEAMQDTLEKGEAQWDEEDFETYKKKLGKSGGDPNAVRKKELDKNRQDGKAGRKKKKKNRGSDSGSEEEEEESHELSSFKRKAGQLETEMKYMDEGQFEGAMERLESRMSDAGRADRKAMKGLLRELDEKYKAKAAAKAKAQSRSRAGSAAGAAPVVDISKVPPEHVATLKKDPSLATEFDKIYGPGASAEILRVHSAVANGSSSNSNRKKPKPEHVDMLMKDPALESKFDQIYGPGSAQELLRRTGHNANSHANIPPEHVEKLRANPHLASEFDRIYGPGTSDQILGTSSEPDGPMELCLDPDDAPAAPDVPMINGREVAQNHIEMLVNNPTLGDKFDQFYGVGAAKQILAQMNGGQPEPEPEDDYLNLMKNTMSEGNAQEAAQAARAQAKANAVDAYQAMREAASPRSQPQPGRKEPSEKHVQMLRDNPAFAPKFDAVYGEGAADAILSEVEDTYREGPMFPNESSKLPSSISPLDLSKIGGGGSKAEGGGGSKAEGGGGNDAENSNSPRTTKWRKENETRAAMGLKPKAHPSKKKK